MRDLSFKDSSQERMGKRSVMIHLLLAPEIPPPGARHSQFPQPAAQVAGIGQMQRYNTNVISRQSAA